MSRATVIEQLEALRDESNAHADARMYVEEGRAPSLAVRRSSGGWAVFRGMGDCWQVEMYRPGPLDMSGWDGYMLFDTLVECVDWLEASPDASWVPRADRVRLAKCGTVVLNTHEIPSGLELLEGINCAQCGAYERDPGAWHSLRDDRAWDLLCRPCCVELEREMEEIYGEEE